MQTNTPCHFSVHAYWCRCLLLLLAVLSTAVVCAKEDAAYAKAPANSFELIQLSTDPHASAAINAKGQVAFITLSNGEARAQFYDGSSTTDLGTLGGINLTVAGVNKHGEAVFNVERGGHPAAVFYDGHCLRELGTLGGPGATAKGLNDRGQVAGTSGLIAGEEAASHVFRWSVRSGMADLGVPGQGDPVVQGINDRGEIFGYATFDGGPFPSTHGFFWSVKTGIVDIGPLGDFSRPTAMNDAGTIVGYGGTGPFDARAFRWNLNDGMSDMGTLSNEFTWAVHINGAGKIVGATPFMAQTSPHPFLWTPGRGLLDLGVGTAERGAGTKVNGQGVVIGYLFADFVLAHGFIWTHETGLIEIGAESAQIQSSADDVNKQGQVVGSLDMLAYRWTRNQGIVDLNTLVIPGPAPVVLRGAHAIADSGAILATASTGLYLLVPAKG